MRLDASILLSTNVITCAFIYALHCYVSTILDNTDPECKESNTINPATWSKMGSITYNWEVSGYDLKWESRAKFNKWLIYEQAAIGIKIRLSKTRYSKNKSLYLTCETFHCACNGTGGKSHYMKRTTCERKIENKRIEGGCPCLVQIKTYPHTDTILGKYDHDHSHPTGKDNLKYIRIRASTRELIEGWVHYGVTDQEIVSDPLFNIN